MSAVNARVPIMKNSMPKAAAYGDEILKEANVPTVWHTVCAHSRANSP